MSAAELTNPQVPQTPKKPRADIYTALLGISLLAIIVSIIFLCLELSAYQWNLKATGAASFKGTSGVAQVNPAANVVIERSLS